MALPPDPYPETMKLSLSSRWRAFPELKGFSDEQCRVWIDQVERIGQDSLRRRTRIAVFMAWFFAIDSTFLVVVYTVELLHRPPSNPILNAIFIVLFAVQGVVLPMVIVRNIRDRWTRRMLRELLSTPRCPWCRYALVGLRPDDGDVTCPECGRRAMLEYAAPVPGAVPAPDELEQ
jgi:hypothetical protein